MSGWTLRYEGFDPATEARRETLCTLGNGYMATRGAAADATAGGAHYPGTYLAGGYNRLRSDVEGHEIESEDLVNIPNWLPLTVRLGDGPWLGPDAVETLEHRQELDLKAGVLSRTRRLRDAGGRVIRWEERRLVSMANPHLAALELRLTPENWSGPLTLRAAVDGGVTNAGVARYGALNGRHLETLETRQEAPDTVLLRSRMVQSRREVVVAARTRTPEAAEAPERRLDRLPDRIGHDLALTAREGETLTVEKVAAVVTSRDSAVSEPGLAAAEMLAQAGGFADLLAEHRRAWAALWAECGVEIETASSGSVRLHLRLHVFHLLQTISEHSVDLDVGVPPRGWTGEAYRGHVMWDELFIFPYLNLRKPRLTGALLRYRHRRLDAARRMAREAGLRGAMFPWQSGSDGREESQRLHLNPMSGNWIPDTSNRQRHINAAVAFNVWQYYEVTEDRAFLADYGAELMAETSRFWASLAERDPDGRFSIRGVMGPDEFHTAYPGRDETEAGGLDNNAYTNAMVAWTLTRTLDALDLLPEDRREALCGKIGLAEDELALWDEISRNLVIPFSDDGVILQFEGYDALEELDWEGYERKYGDVQRLDRILEREGVDPNRFKLAKQADVLMLFFLFSTEELTELFARLGYRFTPEMIPRNIDYYAARTSHGSTLSWTVHAWVMSRADRRRSWALFGQALEADVADLQGGTTGEGVHLGAMAGTVDIVQRCYTGIEPRGGTLTFNPRLPDELHCLRTTVHYRGQTLDVRVTHDVLEITSRPFTAQPVTVAYRGHVRQISPGRSYGFRLVPEREGPPGTRGAPPSGEVTADRGP